MTVGKLKELLSGFDDDFTVAIFVPDIGDVTNVYAIELDLDEKQVVFK